MALLSTNAGVDSDERANERRRAIKLASHKGFKGITRSFLSQLVSKTALVDLELADNILAMANDIGRLGFVRQQTAILGRRDQRYVSLLWSTCARFVWHIGCINATEIF